MFREHSLNKQNPFIRGYYIDPQICDDVVAEITKPGIVLSKDNTGVRNYSSIWLEELHEGIQQHYVNSLVHCIEQYKAEFAHCYTYIKSWGLGSGVKIQRYEPGDYYSDWHPENNGSVDLLNRHLVFMTYLNDISEGGGTEFYHQNLKVKPEKGLTLIWPVDWTHTHKGIVAPLETKHIITGWFIHNTSRMFTGMLY
jgi:hypothetical protein